VVKHGYALSGPSLDRGVVFPCELFLLPWLTALKNVYWVARFLITGNRSARPFDHVSRKGRLSGDAIYRKPSQLSAACASAFRLRVCERTKVVVAG
jgi:ABC-type taurine transport system ATPase subunit